MGLTEIMLADAQAVAAADGVDVTYNPDGGAPYTVKCIENPEGLATKGTDQDRTLSGELVIAVAKADLTDPPKRNADTVTFPGEWVGKSGNLTRRVVPLERLHTRGWWFLELR